MLQEFKSKVSDFLNSNQIVVNELLRYAYSTDASLYRMIPKLVLIVSNEQEIIKLINLASQYDIKLTFRTAGTSLSGQAVTDEVLVVLAIDSWLDYKILDDGKKSNYNQVSLELKQISILRSMIEKLVQIQDRLIQLKLAVL